MNKLAMPVGLSKNGGAKTAVSAHLCLVLEPLSAVDISVGMAKPSQCKAVRTGQLFQDLQSQPPANTMSFVMAELSIVAPSVRPLKLRQETQTHKT